MMSEPRNQLCQLGAYASSDTIRISASSLMHRPAVSGYVWLEKLDFAFFLNDRELTLLDELLMTPCIVSPMALGVVQRRISPFDAGRGYVTGRDACVPDAHRDAHGLRKGV